ncbi:leucine-rich repeat, cysteine-containing subtype protein [Tanacetum coccineum]
MIWDVEDPQTHKVLKMKMSNAELADASNLSSILNIFPSSTVEVLAYPLYSSVDTSIALILLDCLITDMGLEYLADGNLMNSLTGLDLSGCDRISDDGICYLNEFDNLTDLSLSRCDRCLTEDVICAISHIPNIFFLEYCVG